MRPDQTTALERLAAERGVTISELVRQAVDLLLATDTPGAPGEAIALPGSDGEQPDESPAEASSEAIEPGG
jgi:hypothetical protein